MTDLEALGLAFGSSGVYFTGFAFFKIAAARMETLRGTHLVHLAVQILTSATWWCGAAIMALGVVLQLGALSRLPIAAAVPGLLAGLAFLVVSSCGLFGERATPGEWTGFALMLAGALVFAFWIPGAEPPSSAPPLLLLALPSFALPVAVFALGDWRPRGLHARSLTGVAYGLGAGTLIGLAELALSALARKGVDDPVSTWAAYPLLFAGAVGVGIVQLQIALQRCRMITVVFVATIAAKVYLLLASGFLTSYWRDASPWPLLAGTVLMAAAFAWMPHHDVLAERSPRPRLPGPTSRTAPARGTDPWPSSATLTRETDPWR